MQRNCLKCGASNSLATGDELEECPTCGAIYERVEANLAAKAAAARRSERHPRPNSKHISTPWIAALVVSAGALLLIATFVAGRRSQPVADAGSSARPVVTETPKAAPEARAPKAVAAEAPIRVAPEKAAPKMSQDESRKLCSSAGELARSIMTARQGNVPMSQAMDLQVATDNEEAREIVRAMVIAAYEKPRFTTPEFIDRAVSDFESEMYLHCIKAL